MKTWTTKSGYKITKLLPFRGNAYLIAAGTHNILVDTGSKSSYNNLLRSFTQLYCAKIDILIITHAHYDHCDNSSKIKNQEGCKVIMSKYESEFAQKGYGPLPKATLFVTRPVAYLGKQLERKVALFTPFPVDILVDEYLTLNDIGLNIEIIHTPGHSQGSISVIVDREIAIVGDAMFGVFPGSIFPPFANDVPLMRKSWKKLLDTGCVLFLPGHGRKIKRELLEAKLNKER